MIAENAIDEIDTILSLPEAHPQPTAMTDEERAVIWNSFAENSRYKWSEDVYKAIELALSRRTAEPQPAAEPPSNVLYEDSTGGLHCDLAVADAAEPSTAPSEEIMPLADVKWDAPSPAPSGDVIEVMKAAHLKAVHKFNMERTDGCFNGNSAFHAGMTAAYKVARADLLANPPQELLDTIEKAVREAAWNAYNGGTSFGYSLAKDVRARLTPKPVERVTVRLNGIKWEVRRDGSFMHEFIGSCAEELANALAAGLRAELAKEVANAK